MKLLKRPLSERSHLRLEIEASPLLSEVRRNFENKNTKLNGEYDMPTPVFSPMSPFPRITWDSDTQDNTLNNDNFPLITAIVPITGYISEDPRAMELACAKFHPESIKRPEFRAPPGSPVLISPATYIFSPVVPGKVISRRRSIEKLSRQDINVVLGPMSSNYWQAQSIYDLLLPLVHKYNYQRGAASQVIVPVNNDASRVDNLLSAISTAGFSLACRRIVFL